MKKRNIKLLLRPLAVAGITFGLTLILYFSGVFNFFENKTYDLRMVYASEYCEPSSDISFIVVNQDSINWAQEEYGWGWPWPREAYARLIEFVSAGNPESIAFDILYSEPSIFGDEDDIALAKAEADSGKVIQSVFVSEDADGAVDAQFPIPIIKDNAAIIGNITSATDDDDIIRRGRLEYEWNGKVYPTLGTAPVYLQNNKAALNELPRLKDGTVLLRYQRNLNEYNPYPISEILESYDLWKNGEESYFVPEDFEGKYVYVAYYAPGLFDICSTPVSQVFPGVGVHITTLDNYLCNNFMQKVPDFAVCLWILFVAFFASLSVYFASLRHSQRTTVLFMVLGFILGILLTIGLPYILFVKSWWLQLVAPFFCFILASLINITLNLTVEGKQKRFIKAAFSQCLSKDVVNQIMEDPDSFTLGGKNFHMSAIFTDIQKFSSFSELLTASELGSLLNFYLTRMSDIIIAEGGTVDKYEGDAIVALVGAPLEMEDHGIRACSAAIKMKKAEAALNQEIISAVNNPSSAKYDETLLSAFKKLIKNNKTIFTRIGINSGEMIAGYFGSENKKNYTMMGNNVNLASRLEGVNKHYSTGGILISEATKELLNDKFIVRSLDRVQVVNVKTPIRLYELLDDAVSATDEVKAYVCEWENAMKHFESGDYKQALDIYKALSEKNPEDKVAGYYINLTEKFFIAGKYPTEMDDAGVAYNPENPDDMDPSWAGTKYEIKGSFRLLQK